MKQVSLNFGAIKDTVYRFASKELVFENKSEKTTILESFLKTLKENPSLKLQYLIFKNLEEGSFKKERLAERYINQNLKLLEATSWDKVIDSNRDVRIGLLENCHVDGNAGKEELYESIHTLIESVTRKGFSDIDRSEAAYEFILENLLKEKKNEEGSVSKTEENDGPKILSWDFITKLAVNNFNERYSHLNESERELLNILLSDNDKKLVHLDSLKKESLEMINDLLNEENNEEEKTILNQFKTKINNLKGDNLDEEIINCAELKESLVEANS
jgi:hypothetical protein